VGVPGSAPSGRTRSRRGRPSNAYRLRLEAKRPPNFGAEIPPPDRWARAGKASNELYGLLGACLRDRAKPDDNAWYLAQWQAEVRVVIEESARRHTWIACITRILHYCEAAGLFDSNEPFCPVATAPGQYDSNYTRAIYARRRPEEWIGGRPRVMLLRTLVQSNETDRADCHVMVRRRHVNVAAFNAHAISSVLGRKWAGSGKDVR
jgi:hypothetical protein